MTYFLDFDRTLFNTPLLYIRGIEHGTIPPQFVPLVETAIAGKADYSVPGWEVFFNGLENQEFEIIPEDAHTYLYSDAVDFLSKYGSSVTVVTAGRVAVQKRKVERSGVAALVHDVVYSAFEPKGDVLKRLFPQIGGDVVFVDDKESQLASVKMQIPQCSVFQIVRSNTTVRSTTYPIITSLAELP